MYWRLTIPFPSPPHVQHRRAVTTKEGEQFAAENNLVFLETSAKSAANVEAAFIRTAEKIYENIKEGLYDPARDGNGVRLGSMAAKPGAAAGRPGRSSGGCC